MTFVREFTNATPYPRPAFGQYGRALATGCGSFSVAKSRISNRSQQRTGWQWRRSAYRRHLAGCLGGILPPVQSGQGKTHCRAGCHARAGRPHDCRRDGGGTLPRCHGASGPGPTNHATQRYPRPRYNNSGRLTPISVSCKAHVTRGRQALHRARRHHLSLRCKPSYTAGFPARREPWKNSQ